MTHLAAAAGAVPPWKSRGMVKKRKKEKKTGDPHPNENVIGRFGKRAPKMQQKWRFSSRSASRMVTWRARFGIESRLLIGRNIKGRRGAYANECLCLWFNSIVAPWVWWWPWIQRKPPDWPPSSVFFCVRPTRFAAPETGKTRDWAFVDLVLRGRSLFRVCVGGWVCLWAFSNPRSILATIHSSFVATAQLAQLGLSFDFARCTSFDWQVVAFRYCVDSESSCRSTTERRLSCKHETQ